MEIISHFLLPSQSKPYILYPICCSHSWTAVYTLHCLSFFFIFVVLEVHSCSLVLLCAFRFVVKGDEWPPIYIVGRRPNCANEASQVYCSC